MLRSLTYCNIEYYVRATPTATELLFSDPHSGSRPESRPLTEERARRSAAAMLDLPEGSSGAQPQGAVSSRSCLTGPWVRLPSLVSQPLVEGVRVVLPFQNGRGRCGPGNLRWMQSFRISCLAPGPRVMSEKKQETRMRTTQQSFREETQR